ncbi:hypothetical protein EV1_039931 [Malus domestica]
MLNPRTAMDSAFWDLNVSLPQTLEAPPRPFLATHFLSTVLEPAEPLGFSNSLFWVAWINWAVPPEALFSSIKAEFTNDEMGVPTLKGVVKHVLDKSLYLFGYHP